MLACCCRTPGNDTGSQMLNSAPPTRSSSNVNSQEALYLLQKCRNLNHLKLVHAKIIRNGLSQDQLLVRKLLHLCSSFGKMDYATLLFNQILKPHTFTWNLMIRAYVLQGSSSQAVLLYNLMISQGFPPYKFTFPFVIKACLASSAVHKGREVHGHALKSGFFNDTFVRNTLMDLYFKCGDLVSGYMVFDTMRVRTVVSWTTLIAGLISCGELDAAQGAFNQMPRRNVVSWTAIIHGCVKNQRPPDAFELFARMQMDNVRPNEFTMVSLLKACTQLWSLKLGSWIHDYGLKNGFKIGAFLGTALIDMYSKCGSLKDARQVFDRMETKNLATLNTMITSLGVHGCAEEALALFAQMERTNEQPDAITFVGVLCACVSKNDIKEGDSFFKRMRDYHGIEPIMEHYTCLIELYTRANMPDEVTKLVNGMPKELTSHATTVSTGAHTIHNVADVENWSEQHDKESQFLGSSSRCLCHGYQRQCFKWDVG